MTATSISTTRSSLLLDGDILIEKFSDFSEISLNQKSSLKWVDIQSENLEKSLPNICSHFGFNFDSFEALIQSKTADYFDLDQEMGLSIPSVIIESQNILIEYTIVFIKENLIITLHSPNVKRFEKLLRYSKIILKKAFKYELPQDRLTLFLIRIIDENNSRNFDHLHQIQNRSDLVSQRLLNKDFSRDQIGHDIYLMKHQLIVYLGCLWENLDLLNSLRSGDPLLLSDDQDLLFQFGKLVDSTSTQISLAEHLSEVLSSGLEVMQSIYNNHLQIINNRMALLVAYLTVIGTAVLVPNTLATALANPVFSLSSKDQTWYILLMIFSTLFATVFSYWWVKKEGLLPKGPQ